MSKDMLGPLTRALVGVPAKMLGLVLDITNRLGGVDGDSFYTDLAKFVKGWKKRVEEMVIPPLLELIGTCTTPATTMPFIASEKFKLKKDGGICSYLGDNFKAWMFGKVEEPVGDAVLSYARLTKNSLDAPILTELGDRAETSLTDVFDLMKMQSTGQEGNLITNGYANIFYVRDINGVLRGVGVYWGDDGWYVSAYEVSDPDDWRADDRVFSRNSVLTSSVPQESAAS